MANNDVKYGEKDLLNPEDLHPSKSTVAISIRVPGDVLLAYKKLAAERGEKYQALMNDALRAGMGTSIAELDLRGSAVGVISGSFKARDSVISRISVAQLAELVISVNGHLSPKSEKRPKAASKRRA